MTQQHHSMRYLWQLDDTEHWHQVTQLTLKPLADWQLRSFYTGQDLLYGLEECAKDESRWPLVILMDFYLQRERGDQVTRAIRQQTSAQAHLTIVGFSSVRSCSEQICQAGGDCIIKKTESGDGVNYHLLRYLKSYPLG